MTTKNMDARREAFEAWDRNTFGSDKDEQLIDDEGNYTDSIIQQCWMAWNAALDSICVELPPLLEVPADNDDPSAYDCDCYNNGIKGCMVALTAAGVPYK